MLNQKFTYQKLKRVEKNGFRRYALEESTDDPVPSVTTILDALKDKTFLKEWRASVGEEAAAQITKESANIGTIVHKHIEQHILSESRPDGSNLIYKKAKALSDIVIDKGLSNVDEVWGTEVPVYYPQLYAGTTDCVGIWKGKESIIDFKTSRKAKKKEWITDYFMQGAAYAAAHNFVYGSNINNIVIMMIGWDESNYGNYQEFVIEGEEFEHYSEQWALKVQTYYDKYI
jgi:hypothetical protein